MPHGQRFDLINGRDMALILAITERAKDTAKQWRIGNASDDTIEANPTILQIDIATAHLTRGLDLLSLLDAPLLDFWAELVTLQKNIDRRLHLFPDGVSLRYALRKT